MGRARHVSDHFGEKLNEIFVRERMELRSDLERGSQRGARRGSRSASFASGTEG